MQSPKSKYTITATANDAAYGTITGGGDYASGSTAVLTAVPNEGYTFTQWSDGNTDNPRTITVTQDSTFMATFSKSKVTGNLVTNGDVSAGATGWTISGDVSSSDGVFMTSYRTGTITQEIDLIGKGCPQEMLDANPILHVGGDIMMPTYDSGRDGIVKMIVRCLDADKNTLHTITVKDDSQVRTGWDWTTFEAQVALPTGTHYLSFELAGKDMLGWSGHYGPQFDNMFARLSLANTITTTAGEGGTVTGGGDYASNSTAVLTAVPDEGYAFVQWSDGNTDNPRSVTVTQDSTFTATFVEKSKYTITLFAENGTITGAESGTQYYEGTELTLTATPNEGYMFTQWSDGNTDNPHTIIVTQDSAFTATFAPLPQYTITLVADNGTIIGAETGTQYDEGTALTLTATADEGYTFTHWTDEKGDVVSVHAELTITVTAVKTYTAHFLEGIYAFTYNLVTNGDVSAGAMGWTISGDVSSADGVFMTSHSTGTITQEIDLIGKGYTQAMLDANPPLHVGGDIMMPTYNASRNGIVRMIVRCLDADKNTLHTITVKDDSQVRTGWDWTTFEAQAVLPIGTRYLSFELAGKDMLGWSGHYGPQFDNLFARLIVPTPSYLITVVTGEGGTITGDGTHFAGTAATLTATPNEGYTFTQWSDGNTNNPRSVTVTQDSTFTAEFVTIHTVTLVAENGTISGAESGMRYPYGTELTLTVTPNEHYVFTGWSDGNQDNPRTITVTQDATFTATFVEIPKYTITLTAENGTISGAESGTQYYEGTELTLTATPNEGYMFTQWSDGNKDNPRTITVTQDATFTATFVEIPKYTITLTAKNGTISGAESGTQYYEGTELTLTATPTIGYTFVQWSDGNTDNPRTITVTQDSTLRAVFEEIIREYVDLGLTSGTLWATYNVGAFSPEEYGDYFAWGETEPKEDYSWATLKYWDNDAVAPTKYTNSDGPLTLEAADDAATANWGGDWRMPTTAEQQELLSECTWTWTTLNGVNGYEIKGINGNTIFLPAAGYRNGTSLGSAGSHGFYWSSSLYESDPYYAWSLYFNSGFQNADYYNRCNGRSVRPVQSPKYTITATANDAAYGTVTGGGDYASGSTAVLTAVANEGYAFVKWTAGNGSESEEATLTFTVTEDAEYMAIFRVESAATGVDGVLRNADCGVRKVLEDGTIYIIRGDEKYTIDGRKVK